ncbi:hypothetical protein KY289_026182 [Solanum tuberosum]|nr:hypothetical protein KY289_026182 [Solanum tuberosum]
MECITMVTMAFGNQAIHDYVKKAYGRLCKCLGEDFLPYLSLAMPIVLKSAQLSVSNSSDTDDSDDESLLETVSLPSKVGVWFVHTLPPLRSHKWDYTGMSSADISIFCSMIKVTAGNKKIGIRGALLEEKALACHILCCFAAELKGRLHLWVNEESKVHVQARLLEAFNESIQIPGSRLRCRVGLDVAKALSYLHHDCRSCILHLDVKPENILLDENHRAILVDFGLSKLMGKVESRVVTTIKGTRGYLAPEWLLENGISEKSDVYSYGMVLLEMIGGRRNITLAENGKSINSKSKFSYFPKIVSEKLEQGKIMEVLDERLVHEAATGGVAVEMQVKRLACVALSCIQERPSLRPTMARVVEMLEGRGTVEAPRQTTMLILDLLDEGVDHHPGIPRVAAAMARSSDTNSLRSYTMSILSGR